MNTMSQSEATTPLYPSSPTNCLSAGTSTFFGCWPVIPRNELVSRSPKASAMAISLISPPVVFIACCTACVQRPPQPIMPILIVSLPNACAARAILTWLAAIAPPATMSELFRRNALREVPAAGEVLVERCITCAPVFVSAMSDLVRNCRQTLLLAPDPGGRQNYHPTARDRCLQFI